MNQCCKQAVKEEWKEIGHWKPFLHWCRDWDMLLIDKDDPEFENCNCVFDYPKPAEGG